MSDEKKPDFDSIRQLNELSIEYWSARELMPLLGYDKWQRFEDALKRARFACEQANQKVEDHFTGAGKAITGGHGARQIVKDYWLSRFGAYLTALNGDPRKPEIAAAQAYFVVSARENELFHLVEEQNQRIELRQLMDESNRELEQAAYQAGVLPRSFGLFHRVGYEGLYGGLSPDEIKKLKGVGPREDLLDRMGVEELSANSFRATQTAGKLKRDNVQGQAQAMETHREIGQKVRDVIADIGSPPPEELPAAPSIKPLLKSRASRRKRVELPTPKNPPDLG